MNGKKRFEAGEQQVKTLLDLETAGSVVEVKAGTQRNVVLGAPK
jgi:hypothetical protein